MIALVLLRSLLIGLLAAGLGVALARAGRRGGWILLPLFAPALLPAYVAANHLPGLHLPSARVEVVYTLLCAIRLAPLACLVALAVPARHAAAAHSARLLGRGPGFRLAAWWHGDALAFRAGFALAALQAFDEFELASFLPALSWTVPLLDAHAGGLPLAESLRRTLPGLLAKLPLWALLLTTVIALRRAPPDAGPAALARGCRWITPLWLAAVLLTVVAPLAVVASQAREALPPLFAEPALWRETLTGFVLAALAAGIALTAAARLPGPLARALGLLLLLPGSLPLGLILLRAFQCEPLWRLADTPVPLLAAWALGLLPAAVLVRALIARNDDAEARHSARLLPGPAGRWLAFRLRAPLHLAGGLGLAALAMPELTLSSLLAAPAWPTAAVRLGNFMHYGQSARLAALLLLAMLVPLLASLPLLRFLGSRRHG